MNKHECRTITDFKNNYKKYREWGHSRIKYKAGLFFCFHKQVENAHFNLFYSVNIFL